MVKSYLPIIAVFLPVLSVFFLPLAEKVKKTEIVKAQRIGEIFTALICGLSFVAVLLMYPLIRTGNLINSGVWDPGLGISFSLQVDSLGYIFGLITAFLWLLASVYSIEYMHKEHSRTRYNIFSLLSLTGMLGTVFSGSLLGLYIFFEFLTIAAYVLVIHEESVEAINAGTIYLFMGIAGGLVLLVSVIATYSIVPTGDLSLRGLGLDKHPLLPYLFWGYIIGFGVKAGMFPLHVWLPKAHPIAPSQASALLSGILIKAGAYGIFRTIYNLVGIEYFSQNTVMLKSLFILGLITIFLGSAVAIAQTEIKKLLAYSSISQMGYIILGATLLSPLSLIGGTMHVFNHAIIKGCLFLCAGSFIHQTGLRQLDELKGIGYRMPLTTICFTIVALSIIGFPPFNGFLTKWYLALGSLEAGKMGVYGSTMSIVALSMLFLSSVMNLIYYGPIIYNAWFVRRPEVNMSNADPNMFMLIPLILLASSAIFFGIYPRLPLNLIREFVATFFGR